MAGTAGRWRCVRPYRVTRCGFRIARLMQGAASFSFASFTYFHPLFALRHGAMSVCLGGLRFFLFFDVYVSIASREQFRHIEIGDFTLPLYLEKTEKPRSPFAFALLPSIPLLGRFWAFPVVGVCKVSAPTPHAHPPPTAQKSRHASMHCEFQSGGANTR
jgi:hypothetical protein